MADGQLALKISVDGTTQAAAGLQRVQSRFAGVAVSARTAGAAILSVGSGMAKLGAGAAGLALTSLERGLKTVTIAAAAMGAVSVVAFKQALSYGAQMHKTASLLGVDAGQVDILSQAFRENGASAETAAVSLPFMLRAIANGSKAFDRMGLSVDSLKGKSVVEQFDAITTAIRGMTNQEDKVAAMMEVFGRGGGQLAQLINNPSALGDAARTLGSEARLMAEQAATFERVNTLVGNITVKIRTMFTGIAAGLVGPLRGVLEELNSFDVAAWGERIGQAIGQPLRAALQAFREGELTDYLREGMSLAVDVFGAKLKYTLIDSGLCSAFGDLLAAQINKAVSNIPGVEAIDRATRAGSAAKDFLSGDSDSRTTLKRLADIFNPGASVEGRANTETTNALRKMSESWNSKFELPPDLKNRWDALQQRSSGYLSRSQDYTVRPEETAAAAAAQLPELPDLGGDVGKAVADSMAHSQYYHVGGYGAGEASQVRSPEYSFAKNTSDKMTTATQTLSQISQTLTRMATATGTSSTATCTYA